jgi:drug/metabolite transporter (DMT)-like permease
VADEDSEGAALSTPLEAPILAPRAEAHERPLRAALLMALAAALFALMGLLARSASAKLPWQEVALSRALVGSLVAYAVARARGASLAVHDRRLSWARTLFGTVAMMCTFAVLASKAVGLGDAATLAATSPVFVALLAPRVLGERSGRATWLATAVAFSGVAFVAGPTFDVALPVAAIATLGALATALAMMMLRKLGRGAGESPEGIAFHFSTFAAVVALGLSLPVWITPDARGALELGLAGVTGGLAQLAMTRAYALDRAARVGAVGYLGPVLSHLLGSLVLAEPPSPTGLLGTTLVIAAGLVLTASALRERRAKMKL